MKKLSIVLLVIFALVAGTVLILPKLVSTDIIAAKAREQVKAATGRDMNFTGAKFVFWPDIGIELSGVTLSNPAWAKERNMLTLGKADVALALTPLLRWQIEVKHFVLESPVINLESAAGGRKSWNFTHLEAPSEKAARKAASGNGDFGVKLGQFRISKGVLNYTDSEKGGVTRIGDIDMDLSFPDMQSPMKINGSLSYNNKQVAVTANLMNPVDFFHGKGSRIEAALQADVLAVKAGGDVTGLGETFNGNVEANVASLSGLAAWLGAAKTIPFEKLSFNSALRATQASVNLRSAALQLDDVKADGNIDIRLAAVNDVSARLSVNKLNLDRFIGAKKTAEAAPSGGAQEGWSSAPIDFSGLRSVNANLELKTQGFIVNNIDVGASTLTVALKNGNLRFKSTEADLLGGRFSSDLGIDAASSAPAMIFNFSMKGVQAKPLLAAFAKFKKLSGAVDAGVSVASSGISEKTLVSNMKGNGSVVFRNGSLEGIDLANIARMVQKRMTDIGVGEGKTDFVEMGGTFTVNDGIASNSDLKMRGPLLQATGSGTIDLAQKYLKYHVIPVLTASSAVDDASGLAVPVNITGPFSNIKVQPDFAGVVQGIAEHPEDAKKTLKNVREQIKGMKKDPAQALQNLLGGGGLFGQPAPSPQPQPAH